MSFVLSILIALSSWSRAEVLGVSGANSQPVPNARGDEVRQRPEAHQAPRPLVEPNRASIVRQRLPSRILIGQYCTFSVVRGPARSEETRSCLLQGRALPVGSACKPQADCAHKGQLTGLKQGTVTGARQLSRD